MKIGDKVVCIRPAIAETNGDDSIVTPYWPKVGQVYVISNFMVHPIDGELLLKLLGVKIIVGKSYQYAGSEIGFGAYRFRLLDEMKKENKQHDFLTSPVK